MADIIVKDEDLQRAAAEGMDEFLSVFVDEYRKVLGGDVCSQNMSALNGYQHSLLAYKIFQKEICDGGFVQLIQNGYGGYIFDNPFAKSMRVFGAAQLSKLVYKAKKTFDENRAELEKETTDEEFHAMYVDFEAFDELEELYFEIEEETTAAIAHFVDENIEQFAKVC